MQTLKTIVLNNGNHQEVLIPQAFHLDVQQVEISRIENGDLMIHPTKLKRGDMLLAALSQFDDDVIEAFAEEPVANHRSI